MTAKRVYLIMLISLGVLSILIIGVVFGSDKMLKKQSEKLVAAKLENKVLENQQITLDQAKQDLKKYKELSVLSKQIVPSDKDQAKTIREIINLANEAGVSIATIGFPASDLGSPKPAATGSGPQVSSSTTQAKPVDGIKGLLQLDINVQSDPKIPSTYFQLIAFLEKLETNRRTSHVTALSIQPDANNHSLLSFSLVVTVYIKP